MTKKHTKNRREQEILSLYTQTSKPSLVQHKKSKELKKPKPSSIPAPKEKAFLFKDLINSFLLSGVIIFLQLVLALFIKKNIF